MGAMAVEPATSKQTDQLRIALIVADDARRLELSAGLSALGYTMAPPKTADVVLTDNPAMFEPGAAIVALGEGALDATGVLPADARIAQIDAALRAVAVGLVVRARPRQFDSDESNSAPLLTPREVEILVALSDGLSNKQIARRFDISQHTVKFHAESVFRKLRVTTRAEAVAKGLRRGLVHL
jgi:DNA-binding NarL/FixJ family response regulator